MRITFIGTGAGVPTRSRGLAAIAVRPPGGSEVWLFDCGEGTQHRLLESDVRLGQISRIFITHMHGDHIYGLMGLLNSCVLSGGARPIDLYGPEGLADYVRDSARHSYATFPYRQAISVVHDGVVFEDERFFVTARALEHRIPAVGYRIEERPRPGRFDAERARELGVPFGPLFGVLQRGGSVTLPDGRSVDGRDLCGPPRKGRTLAYCSDTTYCAGAIELARDVDLLIHEATFATREHDLALLSGHSTASMAARVAQEAGARALLLTHISPRYSDSSEITAGDLVREARQTFPHTDVAHDGLSIELPPHD